MARTGVGMVAVALLVGSAPAGRAQQSRPGPEGHVYNEEQILRSGAKTVWDALRVMAPHIRFEESSTGQPARITNRGPSTVALKEGPLIYLDGVRLADFRTLASMTASDVSRIETLSGIDGTTRYGMGATSGVIIITTRQRGP